MNTFGYVGGNPLRFYDVLGLCMVSIIRGGVSYPACPPPPTDDGVEPCSRGECAQDFDPPQQSPLPDSVVDMSRGVTGGIDKYFPQPKPEPVPSTVCGPRG